MGIRMPETCWAIFKRQSINLRDWCIWLVDLFESQYCWGGGWRCLKCCCPEIWKHLFIYRCVREEEGRFYPPYRGHSCQRNFLWRGTPGIHSRLNYTAQVEGICCFTGCLLRLLDLKTERSCTWPLSVHLTHPAGFNMCLHDRKGSSEMDAALIQAHMWNSTHYSCRLFTKSL
jgi:hypothetical protein